MSRSVVPQIENHSLYQALNLFYNKELRKSLLPIFLPLFLFIFSPAQAQTPPPGQEPGAQISRFLEELRQKREAIEKKKVKPPEIKLEEKKEKPAAEKLSFVLEGVNVSGATLYKPEDFLPIYRAYLGKKITFREIQAIVDKIKAKYKDKGYLTTTVFLPEQEIKDGIIQIRVIEGKMGALKIEGNKWFSSGRIKKYFHSRKDKILNIKKLQKDLLRLNQNPDLEVKTVIMAGQEPETSDVVLKVTEEFPYHVGTGFDNQGSRLAGKYRTSFSLRSSNALGLFDSLSLNTILSSRSFGESVSYLLPINSYGTKIGLDATHFKMKLGKEFKSFDITGSSKIYTPHILWEIFLTENFQANADCGMEIKSVKKKADGELTVNERLRLPYLGLDFTKNNFFGGPVSFTPRFFYGLKNFLDGTGRNNRLASRSGAGGCPLNKYEQFIRRMQRMAFDTYLLIRSQFQAASRSLPSSELFQLGGANSIRGYPEGDYLADIGGSLNLDWVFPMYLIPENWKLAGADLPLRRQIEPVVFLDMGGGKLKKVLPGERQDKFLVGIGGGLRFSFKRNFSLRLEWARHLGDRPTGGSGPSTFHLTFQSEI